MEALTDQVYESALKIINEVQGTPCSCISLMYSAYSSLTIEFQPYYIYELYTATVLFSLWLWLYVQLYVTYVTSGVHGHVYSKIRFYN